MHQRDTLAHFILAVVVVLGLTLLMVCGDAQARIAFMSHRDGNWEIYVMDADGNNQRNLTNNPDDDQSPAWSPDGKQIAFMSDRDGHFMNGWSTSEIYVMDVNGDNQQKLTNHRAWDGSPSWSPDGKRIVFRSKRDGNWEIYGIDADGGNLQNLTNHPDDDWNPAWLNSPFSVSPAGKKFTMWGRLKQVER